MQYMPLHWGATGSTVQYVTVKGGLAASGGDLIVRRSGTLKRVKGSGSAKRVKGRGSNG